MALNDDESTRVDSGPVVKIPWILFLCRRDAERTQMALGFARKIGGGYVVAHSAGLASAESISPAVVAAMKEKGIDILHQRRQQLSEQIGLRSDIIITMDGVKDFPMYADKQYREWDIEDPLNKDIGIVRFIRDEIRARVRALIDEVTS